MILPAVFLALQIAANGPDTVRLDFPDSVELRTVVDYVAASLEINVMYDEAQLTKKISLRVFQPIPRSALLGVLRTVLRGQGLALIPAERASWWTIVPADKLASETTPLRRDLQNLDADAAEIVTALLPVQHGDLERVRTAIAPYLSKPGGTVLTLPDSQGIVVTDYGRNVQRIAEIIQLLDTAGPAASAETIPIKHQDTAEIAKLTGELLAAQAKLAAPTSPQPSLILQPDPLGHGLIALGLPAQIRQARELVQQFDRPQERSTEIYQPKYVAVTRLRGLLEQLIPGEGLRIGTDDATNALVITAGTEAHARIRTILERFDTAPPESATPLRFYRLLNRRADDVFATLGGLLIGTAVGSEQPTSERTPQPMTPASPHVPGMMGLQPGPTNTPTLAGTPGGGSTQLPMAPWQESENSRRQANTAAVHGPGFSLSLDEHTNSIIAIATPELHRQIERLINTLDRRRPQVLVEVTLVSISAQEGLDLGVELEAFHAGDYLFFTSFGLSSIDPATGNRRLIPTVGGTGVLLSQDEVPIILQALATRGDTRVYSAPRILVDDNASGTLESVAESPYTSVNASNTVATTSFAGFAKAGTQLSIEPHIAEGDHLEIKYNLAVSSFTGAGTGTAPPPRSSDTLTSTIRVPDGYTVVVGGLLTSTLGEASAHLPLIGDIPLIGWLFGHQSGSQSKVRLYAFIKPTILRNEEFEDLKYLSGEAMQCAGVGGDCPPDRYQYMH